MSGNRRGGGKRQKNDEPDLDLDPHESRSPFLIVTVRRVLFSAQSTKMRTFVLLITLTLLSIASLSAQGAEAGVYVGVSQFGNADLGDVGFTAQPVTGENGFKAGARLSLNAIFTGHELSYGYERHKLKVGSQDEADANVQQFYYNFVVHLTPKPTPIRPFVTVGAGASSFSPTAQGIFETAGGETKLGVNYGGGVKVKLGPLLGLRFDVRDHVTGKPNFLDLPDVNGRLHSIEYSAGISLLF